MWNSNSRHPFDKDYCFHINDFAPGDCIIAKLSSFRMKGVVTKVDKREMKVHFKNSEEKSFVATLDEIVMLQGPETNWLK